MNVVLDTNVVVSSILSPSGTPAKLIERWRREHFQLAVSESILAEYGRVLAYPRIQSRHLKTASEIAEFIADFRQFAIVVEPAVEVDVVIDDPSDNAFLSCALAAGADFVISSDPHLLRVGTFEGIHVLRPAEFLALLEGELS